VGIGVDVRKVLQAKMVWNGMKAIKMDGKKILGRIIDTMGHQQNGGSVQRNWGFTSSH